jgi:hypothetical protein
MTVQAIGSMNNKWQGQSGDHLSIEDVEEGATFHAVDTGEVFVYHDGGWVEDLRLIYALKHV